MSELLLGLSELQQRLEDLEQTGPAPFGAEAERLQCIRQATRHINRLIIRAGDLDQLLEDICKNLVSSRAFGQAFIVLLEEPLRFAQGGWGSDFQAMATNLKNGRLPPCSDLTHEASNCIECPLGGKQTGHTVARLTHGGAELGLLVVSSLNRELETESARESFRELAEDIAFGLHNLELLKGHEPAIRALQDSEERYRALVENSRDVVFCVSAQDGAFLSLNQAFTTITGWPIADWLGRSFAELIEPDDLPFAQRKFIELLAGQTPDVFELRIVSKSGEPVTGELMTAPEIENGQVVSVFGFARDITRRKRAQEEIQQEKDLLDAILASTADGIIVFDEQGRILHLNKRFAEMWQLPDEIVETKDDRRLVQHTLKQVTNPRPFFDRARELHGSFDEELDTLHFHDGRVFQFYCAPLKRKEIRAGRIWSFRDMTLQINTQAALRESEETFRAISSSAQDAIVMQGNDGCISYWNESAERIFGFTAEEALGRDLHSLLAPSTYHPAYHRGFDRFKETGRGDAMGKTLELSAITKSGEEIPIEISLSAMQLKGQWTAAAIIRDITDRKKAEEERAQLEDQLRHAQKMEALGTLAGGVAHDMNNMLTAIMGLASVIRVEQGAQSKSMPDIEGIIAACRKGHALTRNLLEFARKDTVHKEPIAINDAVVEATDLLVRTLPKKITLHTDLYPDLHNIEGDPSQINQVLVNLAINATDAMRGEGTLSFQTQNVTLDSEQVSSMPGLASGSFVSLRVSDTGVGMDENTRQHAFDPFFTTKPAGEGTGLGLSSVYGTIKTHGGFVSIESEEGHGTKVRIYLPATSAARSPPIEEQAAIAPSQGGTILLVDDEDLVRATGKRLLTTLGYSVLLAENGAVAVEIFREHRAEIELVLLDLIMPVMDGVETYHDLKTLDPDLRILPCSGYSRERITDKLFALGVTGFVQKPYDLDQLAREIQRALTSGVNE